MLWQTHTPSEIFSITRDKKESVSWLFIIASWKSSLQLLLATNMYFSEMSLKSILHAKTDTISVNIFYDNV